MTLWRGTVERLGWGGVGLSRLDDGRLVILNAPLAMFPGEQVEARLQEHSRHCEGEVTRWLNDDKRRSEPRCEYAWRCGGCTLQGAGGHAGVLKRAMCADLFARQLRTFSQYAAADAWQWLPAPEDALRSRVQLHWDGARLGFMRRKSNEIEPVGACMMAEQVLSAAFAPLRNWLAGDKAQVGRWELATGTPPGDVALSCDGAPGQAWRLRYGGWHEDAAPLLHDLGAARLVQSPGAFFQTSPRQAWGSFSDLLAQWDLRGSTLYDIYGGGGFFSLMLHGRFGNAVLVESSALGCADARVNLAGMAAQVLETDATGFLLAELAARRLPAADSVAILDPPRQGLPPALCDALHEWRPGKLVLIGCDGASFCRDATRLGKSWRLTQLAALDLFPNTPHVECVGLFE